MFAVTPPKQFLLLNVSCGVGVAASLFLVPPKTPLWTWAAGSLLSIAVLNIVLAARARQGNFEKAQKGTDTGINWLRLTVLSVTAVAVGVDFYFHRNKLDALSFVSALLAIVVLLWLIFAKSRNSQPKA
jgi:hypothetical protein